VKQNTEIIQNYFQTFGAERQSAPMSEIKNDRFDLDYLVKTRKIILK